LVSLTFAGPDIPALRRLVALKVERAGLRPRRCDELVLAIDEVLTNSVRHGGGSGQLEIWVAGGRLWFQIIDQGPGMAQVPAPRQPAPAEAGGRGLWIARQLTDDFHITTGPRGTSVTAAVDLAR
jgi:anti-sigma regulatory factor (Ser/Thr protein kinase)